uniref:Gonadotropin releasing hormone 2 n=1 Tax=Microcebus murinus TaxID=30608 RepID=A0A8C5V1G8_MICMU
MASSRLSLVVLLLPAQHWSHDPQNALRTPGEILGTAAGSPAQTACSLPSDTLTSLKDRVPWEGRTMTQWWFKPLAGRGWRRAPAPGDGKV